MIRAARALLALAPLLAFAVPAEAAREAVLSQVKHPHNYYWRELYIPQLTTGPSSVAFMPSGDELVYSMGGSLWRQQGRRTEYAREVTHPVAAYDHQPDVAPDGRSVVFARYDGKAFELWRHDFEAGSEQALTANGGVNLEPRISPDGRRIVFVSTGGTGHFNLKIADLSPAGLSNERYLVDAARKRDRPLLLLEARSLHQSVVVAGRQARLVRHQRGNSLGHGQDLLGRGRGRRDRAASTSTSSRRPGRRAPRSGRTASASCSRTTTAASGTSSG